MSEDRYATFDYSRLISWEDRLRREWSFLEAVLGAAPSKSILDLGSGTGEHARLFASHGFEVTGIDGSAAMIDKARQSAGEASVRFVEGDLLDLPNLLSGPSGAAVCLGNVLPHLRQPDALPRLASALREVLLPGAPVVIQLLNYDRIEAKKERALPLSFLPDRDDPAASLLFLRAMELHPDGNVTFMPTVLRVRADREVPMELVASQRVEIRGWRHHEIVAAFRAQGFDEPVLYGSYDRAPFDPKESRDLIVVASAPGR
jgi:glycine/sarcosine N-methyltransferase